MPTRTPRCSVSI